MDSIISEHDTELDIAQFISDAGVEGLSTTDEIADGMGVAEGWADETSDLWKALRHPSSYLSDGQTMAPGIGFVTSTELASRKCSKTIWYGSGTGPSSGCIMEAPRYTWADKASAKSSRYCRDRSLILANDENATLACVAHGLGSNSASNLATKAMVIARSELKNAMKEDGIMVVPGSEFAQRAEVMEFLANVLSFVQSHRKWNATNSSCSMERDLVYIISALPNQNRYLSVVTQEAYEENPRMAVDVDCKMHLQNTDYDQWSSTLILDTRRVARDKNLPRLQKSSKTQALKNKWRRAKAKNEGRSASAEGRISG